jgi:hypothetical protein
MESGFPVDTAFGETPFETGPWSEGVALQAQEFCRSYKTLLGPPGVGHNLPSLASHCVSLQPMGPRGYAYTVEVPGTIPLWRCNLAGDHFVTDRPDCEGAVVEDFLGWVFPGDGI